MDPICVWQCRWDCVNTASDLTVSLFCFRHSASSSGRAALLAKPQSNHLRLLCAPRGHAVVLSDALNMSITIHVRTDIDGKNKITSLQTCFMLCKNRNSRGFFKNCIKTGLFFSALLKEAANKSGYISEHFLCSVDFKEIYFCKDLKYQSARV